MINKNILKIRKELDKLESKIEHKLNTQKKDVAFFEQNDNCPTCTQPIDLRFKQTQVYEGKKKISELEDGLNKLGYSFKRADVGDKHVSDLLLKRS